jgi:DNA polymerase sigma
MAVIHGKELQVKINDLADAFKMLGNAGISTKQVQKDFSDAFSFSTRNGWKKASLNNKQITKLSLGSCTIKRFKKSIGYADYESLKKIKKLIENRTSTKRVMHFKHKLSIVEKEIQSRVFDRLKNGGSTLTHQTVTDQIVTTTVSYTRDWRQP